MQTELFNKTFIVDGSKSERYGEAVSKTAKLLKRPYPQIHSIFTKEKWSIEEIERNYQNVTKHNGDIPSHILWWHLRKKRNMV